MSSSYEQHKILMLKLSEFESADDIQSNSSLEQAIKLIHDAQNSTARSRDSRSRKLTDLTIQIETVFRERTALETENRKLQCDIDSLKVSEQQYISREEKMSRREEDLRIREEVFQAELKSLKKHEHDVSKAQEEQSKSFSKEREDYLHKISIHETKTHELEIIVDKHSSKIVELERKEDELIRLNEISVHKIDILNQTIMERDKKISDLMTEIGLLNVSIIDERARIASLEERLASIRGDHTVEINMSVSEFYHKEKSLQSTIALLQQDMESRETHYRQIVEKFQATEASMHELLRFLHAVKRGRSQLFSDFEQHISAWRVFFDSNIECLKHQYQVVISTNTEQWVRKDSKLSASVHSLLNELNLMTSAKYPYPQLRTDIPRELDIDVLLTKLYIPTQQPVVAPFPPHVSENAPFSYYAPQSQTQSVSGKAKARRGNRPASAGSTRGPADRYKNNASNNNSDAGSSSFVKGIRSVIGNTTVFS